jgi:hypothetical protein
VRRTTAVIIDLNDCGPHARQVAFFLSHADGETSTKDGGA